MKAKATKKQVKKIKSKKSKESKFLCLIVPADCFFMSLSVEKVSTSLNE